MSEAQKYRKRDAHEALFRPGTTAAQKKQWAKMDNKAKTKKKKKRKGLTDKQRAAEAHAHFTVHHGSAQEAEKLLRSKSAASLSAETTAQLKSMLDPC